MPRSPKFTYENNFENPFENSMSQNEPDLQRFTATGRPMPSASKLQQERALAGLTVADSMGGGTPSLLPFRYTDDSIISIPVQPAPPYPESMLNYEDDGPIKGQKEKKRFSLSGMRRASKAKKQPEFVMKDVTRGEYLKHYAKDDNGKYIGTEEPAADCIFNDPSDYLKYRAPAYANLQNHLQSEDATTVNAEADSKEKPSKAKEADKKETRKKWAFREAMATGNAPTLGFGI